MFRNKPGKKYAEHGYRKDKLFFLNVLKISGSGVWGIPAGVIFLIFGVKPYIWSQDTEFACSGNWS